MKLEFTVDRNKLSHPLCIRARDFSWEAHKNHKRKYTNEPYFNHLQEVAEIVSSVPSSTPEMIAAAYCHDTVEDVGVTLEQIEKEFGLTVRAYVQDLTDVSKKSDGNRIARKKIDLEHTAQALPCSKTIKLADLISNSKSIVEHDAGFAIVYLKEKNALLQVLTEGDQELYQKAFDLLQYNKKLLDIRI